MKTLKRSTLSIGLVALWLSGCGSGAALTSNSDPALKQAVEEYWQAVMLPEWNGNLQTRPNWQKAYALLHADARASLSLEQFSQQEWERVRSRGGCLWDVRIEEANIAHVTASVVMTLRFGQPGDFGFTSRVTTRLRRDGPRWAVAEVKEI